MFTFEKEWLSLFMFDRFLLKRLARTATYLNVLHTTLPAFDNNIVSYEMQNASL